ncbi:MAG: S8 family serine peptidase [Phycisphaerales bacterium]|nr:S8 family serine peptidase [Phycisphaerales bacterium]
MKIKARVVVTVAALVMCTGLAVPVSAMASDAGSAQPAVVVPLAVKAGPGGTTVLLPDGAEHRTTLAVRSARLMSVPGSAVRVALWDEVEVDGSVMSKFAASLDGRGYSDVYDADNTVHLRYAEFDPAGGAPRVPAQLEGSGTTKMYIVQFVTTPLEVYSAGIEAAGGKVYNYLPSNSYLCKLDGGSLAAVRALPYVRWVGVYQPAYKLDEAILDAHFGRPGAATGPAYGRESVGTTTTDAEFAAGGTAPFNIQVFERGLGQKQVVAAAVRALGGTVEDMIPDGFVMRARLNKEQLASVLLLDEVLAVDAWGPGEPDMDNVRVLGGANFIQSTLGMTGQGVRGEVFDGNYLATHVDLRDAPAVLNHGSVSGDAFHGTSTTGIVFGRGLGQAMGRGMLPGAEQPIFGDYELMTNRYTHTAQLVDPIGPYRAVFQSNSWGSPITSSYTIDSQTMDDILFQNDILILNSQSNTGSTLSRPQAWAKNIVSIGGVYHQNNQIWTDDRWSFGASIGPAADGRIKPDLASMYDSVWSPYYSSTTAYSNFSGTSAATPITAGHFGIMFQMWHQGTFPGFGGAASVFASRPHMTTAKALMINTARQWTLPLSGGSDITRYVQGWGHADLTNLYNMRNKMFIVDEADAITPLQVKQYPIRVAAGEPALKVTMTYADRPGTTSASLHRINLLTLKVTNPAGTTFYWGNNGMLTSNWTTSGGSVNTKDTVQNVYIQSPAEGDWMVEVRGDAIVQDGKVETPALDSDFALVVSGGVLASDECAADLNGDGLVDFSDYLQFLTLYDAADLAVDFNGDGMVDFSDYLEFLTLYDAGC